jgi:hypothetical protein
MLRAFTGQPAEAERSQCTNGSRPHMQH